MSKHAKPTPAPRITPAMVRRLKRRMHHMLDGWSGQSEEADAAMRTYWNRVIDAWAARENARSKP